MNSNRKIAKEKLAKDGYTLILYDGNELISSKKRGIAPLLELYESGRDFSSFSAIDRVVGRAAAFMYVLLGIKSIFAVCISELALDVLENAKISVEYDEKVPKISNRDGTGQCPMEDAVKNIIAPGEACKAIKEKLIELSNTKK